MAYETKIHGCYDFLSSCCKKHTWPDSRVVPLECRRRSWWFLLVLCLLYTSQNLLAPHDPERDQKLTYMHYQHNACVSAVACSYLVVQQDVFWLEISRWEHEDMDVRSGRLWCESTALQVLTCTLYWESEGIRWHWPPPPSRSELVPRRSTALSAGDKITAREEQDTSHWLCCLFPPCKIKTNLCWYSLHNISILYAAVANPASLWPWTVLFVIPNQTHLCINQM